MFECLGARVRLYNLTGWGPALPPRKRLRKLIPNAAKFFLIRDFWLQIFANRQQSAALRLANKSTKACAACVPGAGAIFIADWHAAGVRTGVFFGLLLFSRVFAPGPLLRPAEFVRGFVIKNPFP